MLPTVDRCPITGRRLNHNDLKPFLGTAIEYESIFVGNVRITLPAFTEMIKDLDNDKSKFSRYILAGICKNRTLEKQEPVLLDSDFIRNGYKALNPPSTFEEISCPIMYIYIMIHGYG